jgi:hypothetical protein
MVVYSSDAPLKAGERNPVWQDYALSIFKKENGINLHHASSIMNPIRKREKGDRIPGCFCIRISRLISKKRENRAHTEHPHLFLCQKYGQAEYQEYCVEGGSKEWTVKPLRTVTGQCAYPGDRPTSSNG